MRCGWRGGAHLHRAERSRIGVWLHLLLERRARRRAPPPPSKRLFCTPTTCARKQRSRRNLTIADVLRFEFREEACKGRHRAQALGKPLSAMLPSAGQQACGDHGACAWPVSRQISALTAASGCAGGARRSRDQRTFNFDHTAHRTGALWADSRRILGDDAAWAARMRAQVSACSGVPRLLLSCLGGPGLESVLGRRASGRGELLDGAACRTAA